MGGYLTLPPSSAGSGLPEDGDLGQVVVNTAPGEGGWGDLTAADVGAPPTARAVSAGAGLTGGGDLSVNRTLSADFGMASGKVAEGDHTHASTAVGPAGVAPNHRWRMDETTGTALADSVGSVGLTTSGSPTLNAGDVPAVPASGVTPRFVTFDGVNDIAASAAAPSGLANYGLYIAAWLRQVGSGATGIPLAFGCWSILYAFGSTRYSLNQTGVGEKGFTATGSVPVNRWVRVGVWCPPVGSSEPIRVMLNGTVVLNATGFTITANAADKLEVGGSGVANYSRVDVARVVTIPAADI